MGQVEENTGNLPFGGAICQWCREIAPLQQGKLSEVDVAALGLWDAYPLAIHETLPARDKGNPGQIDPQILCGPETFRNGMAH